MSEFLDRISKLSPKRLALLALELQSKLEAAEHGAREPAAREPIAIIGLSCRFPGAPDAAAFWRLLRDGVDAISEIPPERWDAAQLYDPNPDAPGKVATRWGGFIAGADQFEPQLFGIAPREALSMDPQQRVLLETAWEALEDSGYSPDKLTGSATGVFVGLCNSDYAQMQLSGARDSLDMYFATGGAHSVAAGRISYVLGLHGPSLAVDTACSSSLVAVHLAVQSLRNKECRMALAGGVNLILSPDTTIALSRAKMMASDGRCKAFDAAADGFVRSEGCGLIVLKRLSEAVADGDRVLAVIRGSAVNQDGRSNGLTAPNGPSQVSVIRAALADSGLDPQLVSYVETHGTGTSLGDPIEAQALGAALGPGRPPERPLMIGSVKTNLGHAESAAGIAGLIKVVLAMQHGEIPPHLHLTQPNPYIAWDELPLTVPTARTAWQPVEGRRIAGVSSFGFSGTNAHILLESAPPPAAASDEGRPVQLLTLSARSEAALRTLAGRYAQSFAAQPELSVADAAYTANVGRAGFAQRLAVVAEGGERLQTALAAFADGEESEDVVAGQSRGARAPGIVFLFTGHGSHYLHMGRRLYETEPVFRAALNRCAELLKPQLDVPLLNILFGDDRNTNNEDASLRPSSFRLHPLDHIAYSQPALFALQFALAELWAAWGIRPAAVAGHSAGEYVAAVIAGVLSLEDGLRLITARGRLMATLPPDGEMAAIFAPEKLVAEALAAHAGRISIAAVNGPESVTISGDGAAVQAVVNTFNARGIETRRLSIPIAAHSPQIEPILDDFRQVAAGVRFSSPQTDVISGMTGALASAGELGNPDYWRRHLRQPVRFAAAAQTLYEQGYRIFVEIGPHPTLLGMMRRFLPPDGVWAPSLRKGVDEQRQMLLSLGALFTAGVSPDWPGFYQAETRRRVSLPTYPFERERYWFEAASSPGHVVRPAPGGHPLLGARLRSPALESAIFETQLGARRPAFLSHHRIYGLVVLPSPAFIEMALAGAQQAFGGGPYALESFVIHEALVLPEDALCTVQLILQPPADGGPIRFEVYSQGSEGGAWSRHASGQLQRMTEAAPATPFARAEVQARCPDEIEGPAYYARVGELGLEFGESFQGLTRIWRRDGEALGEVCLPEALAAEAGAYGIHPALLDACFHLLGAPLPDDGDLSTYLLIGIESFRLHAQPGARLWNHTVLRPLDGQTREAFAGDIRLYDEDGSLIAEARGLQLKRAGREALLRATRKQRSQTESDWLYAVEWEPRPAAVPLHERFESLSRMHHLSQVAELVPGLERLAAAFALRALRQLGWAPASHAGISTATLAHKLEIVQRHERLLGRLIEIATEAEAVTDLESLAADLAGRFPHSAEVELTVRCGWALAEVLRGQADPLHLLFPNGSFVLTERLYQDSPAARTFNALTHAALAEIVTQWPAERAIRVLEIGAGTGSTTAALLPALPAGRTEYTFSDISPLFLTRAEDRFRAYPFVRYHLLDLEQDPLAQGLPEGRFDVIIAANVVHATADIARSLGHIRRLLAPQGRLLLLEGTTPQRWVDITFGLTEGWWRFSDTALRPDYPLLSRAAWLAALAPQGFTNAAAIPEADFQQALFTAQAPAAESDSGEWLIFADGQGVGGHLAARLAAQGQASRLVCPTGAVRHESAITIDPTSAEAYSRLVDGMKVRGIVHLWSLDSTPSSATTVATLADDQVLGSESVLLLAQALAKSESKAHLWLVTQNAQPVGEQAVSVAQSPVWGLGRVLALEHPQHWGGLIDLGAAEDAATSAGHVLSTITNADAEDQTAWRAGGRYVARLAHTESTPTQAWQPDPDGAYLITGGLGGLGLKIADWLAGRGARCLVLVGRSPAPERSRWAALPSGSEEARRAQALLALEEAGIAVITVSADVADEQQMAALFVRFGADLPPLRGIIHAAVSMTEQPLAEMTLDTWRAMLRPKAFGGWLLHTLSRGAALEFFVSFSSTTALWGSRGLAHYAAANQFLDALSHQRGALGLPALSINWGTWEEMRVASAEERDKVAGFGLNRMPTAQALEVLGGLLGDTARNQVAVASVDWRVLKPAYEARRARPFLAHMNAATVVHAAPSNQARPAAPQTPDLLRQLEAARASERAGLIRRHVRGHVAKVLGLGAARAIDEQQGLFEMGMDSLMSVELKSRLEASVGRSLPSTLTFNYPTIAALADYLEREVLAPAPAAEPPAPANGEAMELDELSEDELAAALAEKLARIR